MGLSPQICFCRSVRRCRTPLEKVDVLVNGPNADIGLGSKFVHGGGGRGLSLNFVHWIPTRSMSHVFPALCDLLAGPDVAGDDVRKGPVIISGVEQINRAIAIGLLCGEQSSKLNNALITNM